MDLQALAGRLRKHVSALAHSPRTPGSESHRQAARYIQQHFKTAGFAVQEAGLSEMGFAGVNVLTEPVPNDARSPLLIVAAHYDSTPSTPGADDNASGVAALLEVATWVRPLLQSAGRLHGRLQLAAYDLEEYGFLGSLVHVENLYRTRVPVRGMISLEMLGYTDHRPGSQQLPPHLAGMYPDVGNFIGVCSNEASRELLQIVTAAMRTVPGLPVECLAVPGNGEILPETRLSDHSSFWDHSYPALMITDTSFYRNPHYHQASDTAETLDYPFLAKVTAGVCSAVERLLSGTP